MNAGRAIERIDVGLSGIADDEIHCGGGLGADRCASRHKTPGLNTHIALSHLRHRIMPSKYQEV